MKDRPRPGIRVRIIGGAREGEIMPYEMQWAGYSFPVSSRTESGGRCFR
jgi:hypothetical protein